jgi:hypothetical protein
VYVQGINISKESFTRLRLAGDIGFAVFGHNVGPAKDERFDNDLGGRSVLVSVACDRPTHLRFYASRQVVLATADTFDDAVRAGTALVGGVTVQATLKRAFVGDRVDVLGWGQGAVSTETVPSTLTITYPEGKSVVPLKPGKHQSYSWSGPEGAYTFVLNRTGTVQAGLPGPNEACVPPPCLWGDYFALVAAGWQPVAKLADLESLPGFQA